MIINNTLYLKAILVKFSLPSKKVQLLTRHYKNKSLKRVWQGIDYSIIAEGNDSKNAMKGFKRSTRDRWCYLLIGQEYNAPPGGRNVRRDNITVPDYRWFQIVNVQKRPVPGGLGFKIVVTVGFRCRAAPAAASQMHYIVNQSAIFSLKTWGSAKRKLENEAYLSPKQLSEEKLPWGEFNEIYRRRKRPGSWDGFQPSLRFFWWKTTPLGKIHLQHPGLLKRYKNIRNSKNITKVSANKNFIAYLAHL